jgi:hypothetical protein
MSPGPSSPPQTHAVACSKKSASFFQILYAIALSRSLLWMVLACVIWGFFPIIYGSFNKVPTNYPNIFLIVRYGVALSGFMVVSFLWKSPKTRAKQRGVLWHWPWVAMGLFLFAGRRLEMAAYGDDVQTEFAIIFSVYFVLVCDCKRWAVPLVLDWSAWLLAKATGGWIDLDSGGDLFKRRFHMFFSDMPEPDEVLSWIIQTILVVSSGLVLLYIKYIQMETTKPTFAVFWRPVVLCLLAALMLRCFFDLMGHLGQREEDDDADLGWAFVVRNQLRVAFVVTICSIAWWGLFPRPEETWPKWWQEVFVWDWYVWLLFLVIVCLLGTVGAYLFENLGLQGHDASLAKNMEWRVKGSDWLLVTANLDPLIGALLIGLLTLGRKEAEGQVPLLLVSAGLIGGVAMLEILKLWLRKRHEMRIYALDAALDKTVEDSKETARILTYLMLFASSKGNAEVVTGRDGPFRVEAQSVVSGDLGRVGRVKETLTRVVESANAGNDGVKDWAVFVVMNGRQWFARTSRDYETREVLQSHKKMLLEGQPGLRIEELDQLLEQMEKQPGGGRVRRLRKQRDIRTELFELLEETEGEEWFPEERREAIVFVVLSSGFDTGATVKVVKEWDMFLRNIVSCRRNGSANKACYAEFLELLDMERP